GTPAFTAARARITTATAPGTCCSAWGATLPRPRGLTFRPGGGVRSKVPTRGRKKPGGERGPGLSFETSARFGAVPGRQGGYAVISGRRPGLRGGRDPPGA